MSTSFSQYNTNFLQAISNSSLFSNIAFGFTLIGYAAYLYSLYLNDYAEYKKFTVEEKFTKKSKLLNIVLRAAIATAVAALVIAFVYYLQYTGTWTENRGLSEASYNAAR